MCLTVSFPQLLWFIAGHEIRITALLLNIGQVAQTHLFGSFYIIKLDDSYQYSLVAGPDKDYLLVNMVLTEKEYAYLNRQITIQ